MITPMPMPIFINGGGGNGTEYEYPFFAELITMLGGAMTLGGMVVFIVCFATWLITGGKYCDITESNVVKIALFSTFIGCALLLIGVVLMAITGKPVRE